jgi:hypothetical protein
MSPTAPVPPAAVVNSESLPTQTFNNPSRVIDQTKTGVRNGFGIGFVPGGHLAADEYPQRVR